MSKDNYTLPEKLAEIVHQYPQQIALQIKRAERYERYTYQNLYDHAQRVARSLVGFGVQKGDCVALVLENQPEWAFIYFGILLAGGIAVPLDPQSTAEELQYFFENSGCKIVFTSSRFQAAVSEAAQSISFLKNIILLHEKKTDSIAPSIIYFSEFINRPGASIENIKILPNDMASILYTSGTTGKPKGVRLTHHNFYSNFHSIEQLDFLTQEHNVLSILPLHHSFPFMVTLLIPLFSHNKITYLDSLRREEILKCLREFEVTILVGVPQFFYLFYETIQKEMKQWPFFIRWPITGLINLLHQLRKVIHINLNKLWLSKIHKAFGSHLKYFVCGGAKLDEQVEVFLNKLGFTLIQGYGLTETAPIVTFNPLKKVKIGSAGKAIPDVNIQIIEPDSLGIGEVTIQGPNVMVGYYRNDQETREVLKEGWFYSGDLGYIDRQGYLFLTGRKKELIVLGSGKHFSPEEVEAHYSKSPYIKELCVFSIGTGKQEKLVAVIVPDLDYCKKLGEINIHESVKLEIDILSRNYSPYKCIMGFVLSKSNLPRTRLGKLKRSEIRDKYGDELLGAKPIMYAEEEMDADSLSLLASPIYQMVAEVIKKEKPQSGPIHVNDHLGMDLGFDSLSRAALLTALEEQIHRVIPEYLVAQVSTIKELVMALDKLMAKSGSSKSEFPKTYLVRKTLWKDLLKTDPPSEIIHKIDLTPRWFAKMADLVFCGSLYAIFKVLWRIKIVGTENLPRDIPFILCANHSSYLDAFLICASVPNWLKLKIFFLGFSEYFDVPIIHHLVKIARVIPLDLSSNLMDAMQACGYVLRHGKAICIFPEGARSPDGFVQNFKKGVGILAQELNISLVPVYIEGAFNVLPRGSYFPRFHSIKIIFGVPYTPDQLREMGNQLGVTENYAAIARGIQEKVSHLLEKGD